MSTYSSLYTNIFPLPLPITSNPIITIPLWLRDTYLIINSMPINNIHGPLNETMHTEISAKEALLHSDTQLFISGSDIIPYIHRHLSPSIYEETITIVIHSLRDFYWNIRHSLLPNEIALLEVTLKQPLPKFKNIFDYKSISPINNPIPLYQLFGTISPFSVLHIPVRYFIQCVNDNIPIRVSLNNTEIVIEIQYQSYDFWDIASQSLITKI